MNFQEAKELLSTCERSELRDHAFGDREVSWVTKKDDEIVLVAEGYFGGGSGSGICILGDKDAEGLTTTIAEFDGREALELAKCGCSVHVERNDSTGPDQYAEGECMPALTLEGVRRELCGK